jgi:serine protease Do
MIAKKNRIWVTIFMIVAGILTLGFSQCQSSAQSKTLQPQLKAKTSLVAPSNSSELNLRNAIAQVARNTIPAVVHIDITQQREVSNPMLPFSNDPFFHFFFNGQRVPRKFKQEMKGLGTGMLIDSKGNILTNNHVVGGATDIKVLLADGSSYPAKIVGTDPKTDLAVIHITADKKLPTVSFGDSDKMEVGDWVVAIGHPRGLDQTVTQGIISAKHRQGVLDPNTYQDYLQTDAAINPGNSGGPLLNLEGQVIGVNAAIETQSGGFEGIGFAIPSNMAVHVAQELMQHGKVIRGWLGVSIGDLTPELVKKMKLDNNKGTVVMEVAKNSPAQKAGLKQDDLITRYDGHRIDDAAALQSLVADTPINKKVDITIFRQGKSNNLSVKIGDLNEEMRSLAASLEERLGATVRPLTEKEDQSYHLQPGQGVAIVSMDVKSELRRAGFEKDDVILEINNIPVKGVEGLAEIANALPPHRQVLMKALDHRTGESGYVKVMLG